MGQQPLSKAVLLCDFDNTIITMDTGEFALKRFGDPHWKLNEVDYERGNITFEESLRREFGSIKVPERVILEKLEKVVVLRPHFEELLQYCKGHNVPFTVVSGGLDFCIRHFLDRDDWLKFAEIYAPEATYTPQGYILTFPELLDKDSINFKQDLVRCHKRMGRKVFYVGDGLGDYSAAIEADFRFAIKDSKLAYSCRDSNFRCEEVTDFEPVIIAINRFHRSEPSQTFI